MSFFLGFVAGVVAYALAKHAGFAFWPSFGLCLAATFIVRSLYDAAKGRKP